MAEDNLINQKIALYILLKQQAEVVVAANGIEAIEIVKSQNIDIILMDLQMPEMDGFEASRFIREELKNNVPIIALTADVYANEYDECLKVGINACISKPFETESLCELILKLTKVN